jgi:hypothetical protein
MRYEDMKELSAMPVVSVCLTWQADRMSYFSPLLQQGFMLKSRVNSSISDVLCGQFGLSQEYLRQRINTIFLDGKPVDDVDSAIIKNQSVLALSAAMPGFVGAAFRKGGFYAAMRREITYVEGAGSDGLNDGYFFLKLYNLVATELATLFLNFGILIQSDALGYFLENRSEKFWSGCLQCTLNDQETSIVSFRERGWLVGLDFVHFRVVENNSKLLG